jgi:hypothetical protein
MLLPNHFFNSFAQKKTRFDYTKEYILATCDENPQKRKLVCTQKYLVGTHYLVLDIHKL